MDPGAATGQHAVHVILGDEDDPHLPIESLNAVLICNTYHELSHPDRMLDHVLQALRPGGRIVVVDRSAEVGRTHQVAITTVVDELRQKGFEVLSQDDHFIDRAGDDIWWLVIARKP